MLFWMIGLFIPVVVSGLSFRGVCYGPFRNGFFDLNESYIRSDMEFFKSMGINTIRTYGTNSGQKLIPSIASDFGIRTFTGVYITDNHDNSISQINEAISVTKAGDIIIVGNEYISQSVASNRTQNVNKLLDYFRKVKDSGRKVAYAETSSIWRNFLDLSKHVDIVLLNTYSFWEGCSSETMSERVIDHYVKFKSDFGNITSVEDILIGETGWSSLGCSICSEENQKKFWEGIFTWAEKSNEKVFVFEIFDEIWKSEGSHCSGSTFSKYFGVFDKNRNSKLAGEEIKKRFLQELGSESSVGARNNVHLIINLIFVILLCLI